MLLVPRSAFIKLASIAAIVASGAAATHDARTRIGFRRLDGQGVSFVLEAARLAARRRPLCRAGSARLPPRRAALKAPQARQPAVERGAQTPGQQRAESRPELQPSAHAGAISPLL